MDPETTITEFTINLSEKTSHDKFMRLTIYVDSLDPVLKNKYIEAARNHNKKIMEEPHFYDAGFDLFLPRIDDDQLVNQRFFWETPAKNKVDFQVKCCAKMIYTKNNWWYYSPFYTYVRSSISKTPLRLANNQGIIDAGYRGSLIGMFDALHRHSEETYARLLQICAPGLAPIYVEIVDSLEELGPNTSRGEGGFGSTGK